MSIRRFVAVSAAALAAGGMLVSPASAAGLPRLASAPVVHDSHADDGFGYRYNGWHRRNHVSTGDVLAGVLIVGAVASIANNISGMSRNRDRNREVYRDRPVQYREPSRRSGGWGQSGLNSAVDMCVSQVERGRIRVDSVDNAARDGAGWAVSGRTSDGEGFSCRLDNDGRIRSIDIGHGYVAQYGGSGAYASAEGQLDDATYARAREALRNSGTVTNLPRSVPASPPVQNASVDADIGSGPQPAYPGGPLPGDEGYEDSLGG